MKWLALLSALVLAGCSASGELQNSSAGAKATCSTPVLGDLVVPLSDNSPYCS
jgi:hypothetical protein